MVDLYVGSRMSSGGVYREKGSGGVFEEKRKIVQRNVSYGWSASHRQGVFGRNRDTLFLLLVSPTLPALTMARWSIYHSRPEIS